jgi:hypothetical protein
MSRNLIYLVLFGCFSLLTSQAFADAAATSSTEKQIEKELITKHNEIKSILFGPVAKIVAAVGALYGIVASFIGSTLRPLIIFGGIGLAASFAEKFINIIFG